MTDENETVTVFLDTETTGLHDDARPWEIAMIARTAGQPQDRVMLIQITDVDLTTADPRALEIGRFYERHVVHGSHPPPHVLIDPEADRLPELADLTPGTTLAMSEALAATLTAIWLASAHIVGVVPCYDRRILRAMFRRYGLRAAWHYHLHDVSDYAAGWLCAQLAPIDVVQAGGATITGPSGLALPTAADIAGLLEMPHHSEQLSKACGVEPPLGLARHTALGDAEWVRRWWDTITAVAAVHPQSAAPAPA